MASSPNAAAFAYSRLELHRASAMAQNIRIWEAATQAHRSSLVIRAPASLAEMSSVLKATRERMLPVLFEIQFYLVAWTNCGRMMKVLTGMPEFLDAKKVFDVHQKTFDHYAQGRNSFEHFHDRLPGRRDAQRVKEVQGPSAGPRRVLFGVEGHYRKHSDKSWDVSPESMVLLNRIIFDVTDVVHQKTDSIINERGGGMRELLT